MRPEDGSAPPVPLSLQVGHETTEVRGALFLRVRACASVSSGGPFEYWDAFSEERLHYCTACIAPRMLISSKCWVAADLEPPHQPLDNVVSVERRGADQLAVLEEHE